MDWQRFDKSTEVLVESRDLNPGGQRIQVIQEEGRVLIADLIALRVECLAQCNPNGGQETPVIVGMLPAKEGAVNNWSYVADSGFEEGGKEWEQGFHPSIRTLLERAWFLSFCGGLRSDLNGIQVGRVARENPETASIGVRVEGDSPVSRNSFRLKAADHRIVPSDSGLYFRRNSLELPTGPLTFNGEALEIPDSARLGYRAKPVPTLIERLKEEDQKTVVRYFQGWEGFFRNLFGEKNPLSKSNWVATRSTELARR